VLYILYSMVLTGVVNYKDLNVAAPFAVAVDRMNNVIIMRKTDPDLPRPFRTPWVPVLPVLGVLVNFLLMLGLGALTWTAFLLWMAIGLRKHHS